MALMWPELVIDFCNIFCLFVVVVVKPNKVIDFGEQRECVLHEMDKKKSWNALSKATGVQWS